MKILSIGYYDDFARFFLQIKKEFKQLDDKVIFRYLSLYLSGFLYFLFKIQNASFFSFKALVNNFFNRKKYSNIALRKIFYKGINLDSVIRYHVKLDCKKKIQLKIQAISYIDLIQKELKLFKPDLIILSGDTRMSVQILSLMATKLNIKTYYFEQGPFNTTMLDKMGVNANSSFRREKIDFNKFLDKSSKNFASYLLKKSKHYRRNPFYRCSDYLFESIFSHVGLIPPDIKMENRKKFIMKEKLNIFSDFSQLNSKVFLLILQVPYDANMIFHSPHFDNHYEIVKNIFNNLPINSKLIVREHPLYKGKYEGQLYKFISQNKIFFDEGNLKKSMKRANVIIVNNSTVGIEAIANLKTVIVLGDSYYDNPEVCLKLNRKKNLNNVMKLSVDFKVDRRKVSYFLDRLINNYLIEGHFRDKNLKSPLHIVNKIKKDKINK